VVDAWRQHLTPVDVRQALTLRRAQRLVANGYEDSVRDAYQDPRGRYVLVAAMDNGQVVSRAEWPVGLDAVAGWNDKTVLAADDHQSLSTLLALTPSEDGVLHADPVPMMPRGGREGFGYGYSGGSPLHHLRLPAALRSRRRRQLHRHQHHCPRRKPAVEGDQHHRRPAPALLATDPAVGPRGPQHGQTRRQRHRTAPGGDVTAEFGTADDYAGALSER
jgi:hypothetical protein